MKEGYAMKTLCLVGSLCTWLFIMAAFVSTSSLVTVGAVISGSLTAIGYKMSEWVC